MPSPSEENKSSGSFPARAEEDERALSATDEVHVAAAADATRSVPSGKSESSDASSPTTSTAGGGDHCGVSLVLYTVIAVILAVAAGQYLGTARMADMLSLSSSHVQGCTAAAGAGAGAAVLQPDAANAASGDAPPAAAASNARASPPTDWVTDAAYAEDFARHTPCDFPVFTALNAGTVSEKVVDSAGEEVPLEQLLARPAVLRGFMDKWPLRSSSKSSWSRAGLLSKYGKKVVVYDAAPSLAYSERKSELKFFSLAKALTDLRSVRKQESEKGETDSVSDSVIHDTSILRSIPKLGADFRVPDIFREWAIPSDAAGLAAAAGGGGGKSSDPHGEQEESWHALSIGASKTGLPFHSHGSSYLSLVHGLKRWFVYPPGASPPAEVQRETHPLRSVWGWFTAAYRLYAEEDSLQSVKKAPFPKVSADGSYTKSVPQSQRHRGYKPLECLQHPGEIVYIPAGWLQSHVNVGETVGVGHERILHATDRLHLFEAALKGSPGNFDAMRQVGVASAYLAMKEESRVKHNVTASTANGMVRLNPTSLSPDLQTLVLDGEDTWAVQYFNQGTDRGRAQALLWNRAAGNVRGLMSVGAIEVPKKSVNPSEHDYVVRKHRLAAFVDEDTGEFTQQVIRIFPGGNRPARGVHSAEDLAISAVPYVPQEHPQKESGLGIGDTATTQGMVDWALNTMGESTMPVGSSTTKPARAKRLYKEAIAYLEKCVQMQPFHAEVRAQLADFMGHAGLPDDMLAVLDDGVRLFNPLASAAMSAAFNTFTPSKVRPEHKNANFIPARVLAPIYHQFAEVLLGREMGKEALPLLEKALHLQANYGPALIDTAVAHITLKDREKVEEAMDVAVEGGAMLKSHPRLSQLREFLDALDENEEKRRAGEEVEDSRSPVKLTRRGQPSAPPKNRRVNKAAPALDGSPAGVAGTGASDKRPAGLHGQKRGMSREEALETGKDKFDSVREEGYTEAIAKERADEAARAEALDKAHRQAQASATLKPKGKGKPEA